jgi:tRNA pseudouridine55 synthase
LVRDIGLKLNVPAVMNSLVRTRVGNFTIDNSFTLEEIYNNNFSLINIIEAFPNIPTIKVDRNTANKINNGVILDKFFNNELAFIIDENENLIALYKNVDNKSRPYKMFI